MNNKTIDYIINYCSLRYRFIEKAFSNAKKYLVFGYKMYLERKLRVFNNISSV